MVTQFLSVQLERIRSGTRTADKEPENNEVTSRPSVMCGDKSAVTLVAMSELEGGGLNIPLVPNRRTTLEL